MLYFCVAFLLAINAQCAFGTDMSSLTSLQSFQCLLQNNYTFFIVRAYHSYGGIDVNAPKTIQNAIQAGFSEQNIGAYMFPCYSQTHSPEAQVAEMVQGKGNSKYSSIWIDMESNSSPNCGWSQDFNANCEYTKRLVAAAEKSGKKVGIYASAHFWTVIMGGTTRCYAFASLPLWYAHYDGVTNFNDFQSFGGWTQPYAKQYKGTTSLCNASVDLNWKK